MINNLVSFVVIVMCVPLIAYWTVAIARIMKQERSREPRNGQPPMWGLLGALVTY